MKHTIIYTFDPDTQVTTADFSTSPDAIKAQAVADYKKRLVEELDMLFKANVVLDDPHTRVLMDRQASHIKRIVEETE